MSDLLVGLDVLRAWSSSRMSKYVAARSVFFTSGLGFIYPSEYVVVRKPFVRYLNGRFVEGSHCIQRLLWVNYFAFK